jgi:hypothetical protein
LYPPGKVLIAKMVAKRWITKQRTAERFA